MWEARDGWWVREGIVRYIKGHYNWLIKRYHLPRAQTRPENRPIRPDPRAPTKYRASRSAASKGARKRVRKKHQAFFSEAKRIIHSFLFRDLDSTVMHTPFHFYNDKRALTKTDQLFSGWLQQGRGTSRAKMRNRRKRGSTKEKSSGIDKLNSSEWPGEKMKERNIWMRVRPRWVLTGREGK